MGEKYKRIYRKRGTVHLTIKVLPQSSMMYNWIELPKRTNLHRDHQVHRRKSNEQQKIKIISHYSTSVQKKSGKRTKDKMEDKANKWKRGQAIGACSLRGRADWSNDRYALLMLYNYSEPSKKSRWSSNACICKSILDFYFANEVLNSCTIFQWKNLPISCTIGE